MARVGLGGVGLVSITVLIGAVGYRSLCTTTSWVDAIYAAAMIATGMGPVADVPVTTAAAKLFVSAYAVFSGVVFLTFAATLLGPVAQRVLHRFHLDQLDDKR